EPRALRLARAPGSLAPPRRAATARTRGPRPLCTSGWRIARPRSAAGVNPAFAELSTQLGRALALLRSSTEAAWSTQDAELATANATPYLQGFGHVVIAWLLLDIAIATVRHAQDDPFAHGKARMARYFFDYELPKVEAWFRVAAQLNRTCLDTREEWFAH
ncbi:MAG: acyl-CoA dehydrogenase C-terminal domain-containing protein, partial [Pseudomonadota bacterium]